MSARSPLPTSRRRARGAAGGTAVPAWRRGPATLAVAALAATAALPALGAVPSAGVAQAAESAPLTRVVVTAVGAGEAGVAQAAAAVTAAGGRVLDRLPLVDGVSADLPAGVELPPGLAVSADRPVSLSGATDASDGPASTVRETLGLGAPAAEGRGVTVAVVDTGVAAVPDLAGRLTQVDVSGAGAGDGYGHGTFVAGLVAGSGASSGGRYAGVAPGADVLSVRVADDDGKTDLVTVLRGLQVARSRGADVVNLSLSSYSPLPWQLDPLTVALTALWESGTVVVVPAGNDGPDAGTVTSPGTAPELLTVGAVDEHGTAGRDDDGVASFSSVGPAPQGVAKPEVLAPGRSVVSLRSAGSVIDRTYGGVAAVGTQYFKGSGTSFATAVASGAAAVLLAERRLSPDQVKALLVDTAYSVAGSSDAVGAGGLDLAAARDTAAPAVGKARGKTALAPGQLKKAASVPGSAKEWRALVDALQGGDAAAAASSWSHLDAEAHDWVASSWSSLPADLRESLTQEWTGRNWGGLPAEQWASVDWAARAWAASSWSGRNWGASSWSGLSMQWLTGWDGRNWGGRNWGGRNWGASSWSGRNWGASSWSGRNWGASSWSGWSWDGRNWGASSWAASSWAASWDS